MFGNDSQSNGLVFRGAIPNSPAEKAGMRKGDIILSIDNQPISSLSDYVAAMAKRTSCIQKMDVLRNGKLIEISLEYLADTPSSSADLPNYEAVIKSLGLKVGRMANLRSLAKPNIVFTKRQVSSRHFPFRKIDR